MQRILFIYLQKVGMALCMLPFLGFAFVVGFYPYLVSADNIQSETSIQITSPSARVGEAHTLKLKVANPSADIQNLDVSFSDTYLNSHDIQLPPACKWQAKQVLCGSVKKTQTVEFTFQTTSKVFGTYQEVVELSNVSKDGSQVIYTPGMIDFLEVNFS